MLLVLVALGAAYLSFQALGLVAAAAAALLAGIVGLRRSLSFPLALSAASAAGAALVHFAVAPAHFGEWWGFGLFFVLAAEVQLGWALLLGRNHGRRMLAAGIVGSLSLVGIWGLSRTTGLPFGPEHGVPEAIAIPDLVSVGLELVTAASCVLALRVPQMSRPRLARPFRAAGLAGAVVLTAWALVAVGAGHSHLG